MSRYAHLRAQLAFTELAYYRQLLRISTTLNTLKTSRLSVRGAFALSNLVITGNFREQDNLYIILSQFVGLPISWKVTSMEILCAVSAQIRNNQRLQYFRMPGGVMRSLLEIWSREERLRGRKGACLLLESKVTEPTPCCIYECHSN